MKKGRTIFYTVYTVLFGIMAAGVFGWFFFNGKSLLANGDAWRQHIRALALYSKYLRGVFYHIIHDHSLSVQNFAFGMGYGSDLYPTLQYYALGDPLNVFSAFVPSNFIYYYFQVIIVLRGFIAGITFSAFAFYMKKDANKIAVMTAAFVYAFCGTMMYLGIWHPFFANPLIYLPLVLMGAEKIIREKKPLMFMISVLLSSVCSFYFFYMIVLITIVYVLVRVIAVNGLKIDVLKDILHFLVYGIIGTLMSMVVLLPVLFLFSTNPRTDSGITLGLFFDPDYYYQLLRNLISFVYYPVNDTALSYNFLAFIVLAFIFIKVRHKKQHAVMGEILLMFLLFPVFGYILGGFAYTTGRWSFAFSLYIAYLIVDMWDELFDIKLVESIIMAVVFIVFWQVARAHQQVISYPGMQKELIFAAIAMVLMLIISQVKRKVTNESIIKKTGLITSVVLSVMSFAAILTNAYYAYSPEQGNMIADYFDLERGEEFWNRMQTSEVQATEEIEGETRDEFYRYTGKNLVWNASILDGISSTQYFWSLANGVVSDYFMEMGVNDQQNFAYLALDDRMILNTLAGVKYYTLPYDVPTDYAYVPYEYTRQEGNTGDYVVFENDNTLPLGYMYSSVIPQANYDEMTPYQKQEALLFGCVVNDEKVDTSDINETEFEYTSTSVPYEMSVSDGIKIKDDGTIKVKEEGASITFTFTGVPMSETYLYFKNLWVKNDSIATTNLHVTSYIADTMITSKNLYYIMDTCQFYSNWHDYMVNTGFTADAQTSITVSFDNKGTYTFDSIEVVCQPVSSYDAQMEKLHESVLTNVDLNKNAISKTTNKVTGEIDAASDGAMCITIPYSSGWSAYVDGEKTDIFKLNTMFMGVRLNQGHHEIVLKYHTPGYAAGWILTILGIVCCVIVCRMSAKQNV